MFLLFPISKAIYVFIRSTIYIPICFYYFLNEIGTKTAMNYYLHSNMFLLFRSIIKEIFTECANLHSNMFLLFQMGIKIPPTFRLNLHSNMFLLFPAVAGIRYRYERSIYIPICFYYFTYSDYLSMRLRLFTFQYVSIISS